MGAKLKPEWLKSLFDRGAKDRPYMLTRMPKFDSSNVGNLVAALEQADAAKAALWQAEKELGDSAAPFINVVD